MDIETLRNYCIEKEHVTEEFPFDADTLVFKVCGKMFLLTDITSDNLSFNVKCDPELAVELREKYTCVLPGYHQNKKHWNTINIDGSVSNKVLKEWIDHSYDLVLAGVPKGSRKIQ